MCVEIPRFFPGRAPVPAEIQRANVEAAGEPLFGELPEPPAVAGDAVEADDRWGGGVTPFLDV